MGPQSASNDARNIGMVGSQGLAAGSTIGIAIAEGHDMFRLGLANALRESDAHAGAIVLAPDYATLQQTLREQGNAVSLALVDWGLTGMKGVTGLGRLRAQFPLVNLMVLSASEDEADIKNAFRMGVVGYVPRSVSVSVLRRAVDLVCAGGLYVPPQVLPALLDTPPSRLVQGAPAPLPPQADNPAGNLSARQNDVARELAKGKSNKLIARALGINEGTVKLHVAAIFRTLNVRNRTEAVLAFTQSLKRSSEA